MLNDCLEKSVFSEDLEAFTITYRTALKSAGDEGDFDLIGKIVAANTPNIQALILGNV